MLDVHQDRNRESRWNRERGDEDTKKEAEKERGDEIKKFQKMILQTQNLGRTVNKGGTEWGLGREKNLPPSKR